MASICDSTVNDLHPAVGRNASFWDWQQSANFIGCIKRLSISRSNGIWLVATKHATPLFSSLPVPPASCSVCETPRSSQTPFQSSAAVVETEKEPEVAPSACLTQPCRVTVFHNGMHEGGAEFVVSPADMEYFTDVGQFLGPKMECVSEGMRYAPINTSSTTLP